MQVQIFMIVPPKKPTNDPVAIFNVSMLDFFSNKAPIYAPMKGPIIINRGVK